MEKLALLLCLSLYLVSCDGTLDDHPVGSRSTVNAAYLVSFNLQSKDLQELSEIIGGTHLSFTESVDVALAKHLEALLLQMLIGHFSRHSTPYPSVSTWHSPWPPQTDQGRKEGSIPILVTCIR
jgi:hypothetical protein